MSDLTNPPVMASWSAAFLTKLHRYRALLRRRWWVLLVIVSISCVFQGVTLLRTPDSYRSEARMMVSPRMQFSDRVNYNEEYSRFFGTQVALMQSGKVRQRATEHLQAALPEMAPSYVDVRTYQDPKTSIFTLSATGSNPVYTQKYLDAMMQAFIQFKDDIRTGTASETLSDMQAQIIKLEQDLAKAHDALFAFQRSHDVGFLEKEGNTAAEYLLKLQAEYAEMSKELKFLKTLNVEAMPVLPPKEAPKTQPGAGEDGKDAADKPAAAKNDLHDLASGPESDYAKASRELQMKKSELEQLSKYLRPVHPKIKELVEDIASMENALELFRQQSLDQLQKRRETLELQMKTTAEVMKEWEQKALQTTQAMAEYSQLKANVDRINGMYSRLSEMVKTIDINENVNQTMIKVLEDASAAQPVKKNALSSMVKAVLLGLALGVGILVVLDRIDDRINSYTELREFFEEPVLGQIPLEDAMNRKRVPLLSVDDERQVYSEAFRNVRSSLLYMALEGSRPKCLLITSAIPGEGKSTVAANLAITMAFSGSKVLLVDADLRKGLLHEDFGCASNPGLSDVLSQKINWKEALIDTGYAGLHFLPRGKTASQVGELLLGPLTEVLLHEFRQHYDWLIVDSAPVLATDDTTSLAPKVDAALVVMRASHTSSRLTQNALDALYNRQVKVLGMIFNCIDTQLPDYYHYQYYRTYYNTEPD
jgi:capsular exopolysaccharide synthesis family protein